MMGSDKGSCCSVSGNQVIRVIRNFVLVSIRM